MCVNLIYNYYLYIDIYLIRITLDDSCNEFEF